MEHLIIDLKENLIQRRKNEVTKIEKLTEEDCKDLILISSGKIFELDFLITILNETINYNEKMKNIQ